ncbi:MAG TPA: hypothetical protein VHE10_00160 [Candidatus Paceibacterota bacterium]|nr:hypothetical protein [Candidatus Paceibacterota bacterium]
MATAQKIASDVQISTDTELSSLIERLTSDRQAFNDFIYTSLEDAAKELAARHEDSGIARYVADTLPAGVPEPLAKAPKAVLFRQLATPNYEFRRFISIADAIGDFEPLLWEYHQDKFTSNNECKKSWGKMSFYLGKGKKGGSKIARFNVIDFNSYNGKKIDEVKTLWGQSLIDFHHELIEKTYSGFLFLKPTLFDASEWFSRSGGNAKDYYRNFLTLFLKNAILFENFMLDEKEIGFTKEVFLPAFIEILRSSGRKPLIVALEPTDIEGEEFWMCHPSTSIEYVKGKSDLL